MKPESLYNQSWVLKLLFNKRKWNTLLYAFILISVIFVIGCFVNKSENSLTIEDGSSDYYLKRDGNVLIDTVNIADNTIYLNMFLVNRNTFKLNGIVYNRSLKSEIQKNINRFNGYISLIQSAPDTLYGKFRKKILGRDLIIETRISEKYFHQNISISGIGYLEDYGTYLLYLAFILTIYLLRILVDKFLFAFTGINSYSRNEKNIVKNKGLLKVVNIPNSDDYEKEIKNVINVINIKHKKAKRIYYSFYIVVGIAILYMSLFSFFSPSEINGNWNFSPQIYWSGYVFNQIKDVVLWLIIMPPILVRVLLFAYFTIKLTFEFDKNNLFDIHPVSPDKAGGLAPLGEVTLILFYMAIAFLPHFFATSLILGYPVTHKVLYPIYFLGTFYLFFFPLSAPHRSMKNAKIHELELIAKRYNSVYDDYKKDEKNNKKLLEEMKEIDELYKKTEKMPIWPFDVEIFIKFGAIFFSGFGIYLIDLIKSLIK